MFSSCQFTRIREDNFAVIALRTTNLTKRIVYIRNPTKNKTVFFYLLARAMFISIASIHSSKQLQVTIHRRVEFGGKYNSRFSSFYFPKENSIFTKQIPRMYERIVIRCPRSPPPAPNPKHTYIYTRNLYTSIIRNQYLSHLNHIRA
jgi:hypothetical protein